MASVIGVGIGAVTGAAGQQKATEDIRETAISNIAFLEEQGEAGRGLISEAEQRAKGVLGGIPQAAITPVQPFADIGRDAFTRGRADILSGRTTGPLADIIAQAGRSAVSGTKGLNLTDPIRAEIARRANLTGQSFAPGINQQLLQLGRTGLAATGDIGGIKARQAEAIGDIARQSAAGQASALIGQVPGISQQIQTGQEARILSDVSGQQLGTTLAEQASQLAGRRF
ncbi:hypothetical protein KAR91_09120 [Candidatus Pacearchaeota archaeon]|nr:hypothetical protein [Candidatus Pacearchaeota archaeon]